MHTFSSQKKNSVDAKNVAVIGMGREYFAQDGITPIYKIKQRNPYGHWTNKKIVIFWYFHSSQPSEKFFFCIHPLKKNSNQQFFPILWKIRCHIMVTFTSHLKKLRSIMRFWSETLNWAFFTRENFSCQNFSVYLGPDPPPLGIYVICILIIIGNNGNNSL